MPKLHRRAVLLGSAATAIAASSRAFAQKKYDTGATDSEIKIGNIIPYSGPASAYGAIGKTEDAYFRMINDRGGINGRKINFISYDDAYSPPKAVEQVRKLVESDEILALLNPFGTPSNTAIQKYMNAKKIPQLFLASGASKWDDPKNFPWTMGFQPNSFGEGLIYTRYILREQPDARVAVLYQNDDFGKDYVNGIREGFKGKPGTIVIEDNYELTEPTIDSHIVKIKASNPTVVLLIATPKFAAQGIRKIAEMSWKPMIIVATAAASLNATMKPAGYENAQGVMSASYLKDALDPGWDTDPGMQKWNAFMDRYMPGASKADGNHNYGYSVAQAIVDVLTRCGDNLTRENVLKQAASFNGFAPDTFLPGITMNTSASDYAPVKQMRMMRIKGERWEYFGDILSSVVTR